jgi:hypothetical protein
VTTLSGTTITVLVGIHDSVDRFKQLVAQRTGIPDYQQLMTYGGQKLSNRFTMYQYRIRNYSTVLLVTQVHGG